MKQSTEIGKLAAALVAVQAEVTGVAKDSTNPDYRSSYTSLDAIIAKIRPVLAKHSLAVVQGAITPHSDDVGRIAAIAVETMLVHSSGEWLSNTAIMPVVGRMLKGGGRADVDPQAGGSALTYGRRYGIAALLCLSTGEDDDGNAASTKRSEGRAGRDRATAGAGQQAEGLGAPATAPARAAPLLTRDSKWPASPHLDVPVKDLPDVFVKWACEPGRKLGSQTDAWQKVLREELVERAANGAKAGV